MIGFNNDVGIAGSITLFTRLSKRPHPTPLQSRRKKLTQWTLVERFCETPASAMRRLRFDQLKWCKS